MSARSAQNAPAHIVAQKGAVGAARANFFGSDAAPSFVAWGSGLQDHRLPWDMYAGPAGSAGVGVLGFYGEEPIAISAVPAAVVAGNIAAAQVPVNGTNLTLAGASTGITVATAAAPLTTIMPGFLATGQAPLTAGVIIDVAPTPLTFGLRFKQGFYDRTKMIARAVSVTGVAAGVGGAFLVSGFDVYGYAMSELITATAGATTVNGKKAFKVVTSIRPSFSDPGHNYSFQTTDIIGLPILTRRFEDLLMVYNNTSIAAATGFVAADVTAPATTTTGDVRGTYVLQSASDNAKRFSAQISPSLADLASAQFSNPSSLTTGLFGQPQV